MSVAPKYDDPNMIYFFGHEISGIWVPVSITKDDAGKYENAKEIGIHAAKKLIKIYNDWAAEYYNPVDKLTEPHEEREFDRYANSIFDMFCLKKTNIYGTSPSDTAPRLPLDQPLPDDHSHYIFKYLDVFGGGIKSPHAERASKKKSRKTNRRRHTSSKRRRQTSSKRRRISSKRRKYVSSKRGRRVSSKRR